MFTALREKHELLDDKIAVMSLVEHVFSRSADDRNIPFLDIAKACDRPLDKVRLTGEGVSPYLGRNINYESVVIRIDQRNHR